MRTSLLAALACGFLMCSTSCADHLPDQDLRILTTPTSAKLSASDLWKDFQKDPVAAKSTYFGKAVDISDAPSAIEADSTKGQHFFYGQEGERGVRARLLEDRAADILKDAKVGARLTLRCFCEGRDETGDVVLKSCYRP